MTASANGTANLTVRHGDTVKATATPATGYSFNNWSAGYLTGTTNPATGATVTADKNTDALGINGTFSDNVPTCSIANGTTAKKTVQPFKLNGADDIGVVAYYWGTSNTPADSDYTTVTSTTSWTLTGNGSTAGAAGNANSATTWYLKVKDASGGVCSTSVVVRSYTVHNMLLSLNGTKGTYNSTEYPRSGSATTYYIKNSTSLTSANVCTTPTGGDALLGYNLAAPATTGSATLTATSTNIAMSANRTVSCWYNRKEYTVKVNSGANGSVTANTETQTGNSVTVAANGTANLTVRHGDTVKATATPATGYSFDKWTGYVTGSTNPATGAAVTEDKTTNAKAVNGAFKANTYTVNYDENLFVAYAPTRTAGGVTTTYDRNNQYLTINNTQTVGTVPIGKVHDKTFATGNVYKVTLNYISGSFSSAAASPNNRLYFYLRKDGSNFSSPVSGTHYKLTTLPTAGSTTSTVTINDSSSEADEIYYYLYQNGAAAATQFTDYKIQVLVTKVGSKEVTYGSTYGDLPVPLKPGYTFGGWYTQVNGGTKITSASSVTTASDHDIHAHWTPINFTLKFASTANCPLNATTYANVSATYETDINIPNPTCDGYEFTGWTASGAINTESAKYGTSAPAGSTWSNGNKGTYFRNLTTTSGGTVTLTAGWKDVQAPVATVTVTSTLKSTTQTATLKCTDNENVKSYYWGPTAPTSTTTYSTNANDIAALKSSSGLSKTITLQDVIENGGTYYLSCKDTANPENISTPSTAIIYTYTVNNMYQNATGSTYTTTHYTQASTYKYIAPKDTSLVWTNIYTVPSGSRAGRFVGASLGAASTTAVTPSTNAVTLNGDNTYSTWFTRNVVYFKFLLQDDEILQSSALASNGTTVYTWSKNTSNSRILRSTNGGTATDNFYSIRYGNSALDLPNYNNPAYLNIMKNGYSAVSSQEFICASGCSTANRTFKHTKYTDFDASDVCSSIATEDCTISLKMNWEVKDYTLTYDLNGCNASNTNPTSYNITSSNIPLNNPTCTGYTFTGWTEEISGMSWHAGFINLTSGALGYDANYTSSYYSDLIYLRSGETYTLSGYGSYSTSDIRWRIYNLDGTYSGNGPSTNSYTPTSNCYVRILYYKSNTSAQRTGTIITRTAKKTSEVIYQGSTVNRKYTANWDANSYTVNYDENLLVAFDDSRTVSGLTVTYDKNNQYLTINGTQTGNAAIGRLFDKPLTTGEVYRITVNYISGTFSSEATSPNNRFYFYLRKEGANYSGATHNTHYRLVSLPKSGSQSQTLTISDTVSDADEIYFYIYQASGAATVFTNYKIQVLVTKVGSKSVTYQSTYGDLYTPVKPGYSFEGWHTGVNGGTEITSSSSVTTASNHDIHAHWTPINYTVKFASTANCPLNATTYANVSATYETDINKANPTCTGYTFTGWTASGDINTKSAKYGTAAYPNTKWANGKKGTYFRNLTTTSGGTVTLTAGWTGETYTATIYYNSNTTSGSITTSTTTAQCTVSNAEGTCTITVPTAVTNSLGKYNTPYKGVAAAVNSMTTTSLTISEDTTLYAIYGGGATSGGTGAVNSNVTIYRPSSESECTNTISSSNTSTTYYRNEFFTNVTSGSEAMTTVISTSATGKTNFTPTMVSGYTFKELRTGPAATGTAYTVANAAKTTTRTFYVRETTNVTVTATFWYNSNSTAGSLTAASTTTTANPTKTLYCTSTSVAEGSNSTASASIPAAVRNSVGKYNTPYHGLTCNELNSFTVCPGLDASMTALNMSVDYTYYAVYGGGETTGGTGAVTSKVTEYLWDSSGTNRTVYRNEWFTSVTSGSAAMKTVLSTSTTGTSNLSTAAGSGGAQFYGYSLGNNTTRTYSSVAAAATSRSTSIYRIYKMNATFAKGANVSAIGATEGSCYMAYGGTSCSIETPSITPNTGFHSVGWSTTNGATSGTAAGSSVTVSTNGQKYYANAVANTYTVRFHSNLGYVNTKDTVLVKLGTRVYYKKNAGPALVGYVYNGNYTYPILVSTTAANVAWFANHSSCTNITSAGSLTYNGTIYYYTGNSCAMSGNLTNSSGVGNRYKITASSAAAAARELLEYFDTNTGTVTQSFTYGTAQNLTANSFSKYGHTFYGWSTTLTGTRTYTNSQSANNLTTTNDDTIDLYALWTPYTYSIKFNANGGSGTMSNLSMTFDVAKDLTANTFTKVGYDFDGWATSTSGSVAYADEENVWNLSNTNGSTVNLYAKWARNFSCGTVGSTVKYANKYWTVMSNSGGICELAGNFQSLVTGSYNERYTKLEKFFQNSSSNLDYNSIMEQELNAGLIPEVTTGTGIYINTDTGNTGNKPNGLYWTGSGSVYNTEITTVYQNNTASHLYMGVLHNSINTTRTGYVSTPISSNISDSTLSVSNSSSSYTYASSYTTSTYTPPTSEGISFDNKYSLYYTIDTFSDSTSIGNGAGTSTSINWLLETYNQGTKNGTYPRSASSFQVKTCGGASSGSNRIISFTPVSTTKYKVQYDSNTPGEFNYATDHYWTFAGYSSHSNWVYDNGAASNCKTFTEYTLTNSSKSIHYRPHIKVKF